MTSPATSSNAVEVPHFSLKRHCGAACRYEARARLAGTIGLE
jgi:hypothetical protein